MKATRKLCLCRRQCFQKGAIQMTTTNNNADSFTVEDIRRNRDQFSARHTDANGKFDWEGAFAATEKGAAIVRAEIERIRAENTTSEKQIRRQ